MAAKWIGDKGLGEKIISLLCDCLELKDNGTIEYINHTEFSDMLPFFNSRISVSNEISASDKSYIVRRSIISMKSLNKKGLDFFLNLVQEKSKEILSQSPIKYYMSSTISFRRFPGEPVIRKHIGDVRIVISHRFPKHMQVGEWFLNGYGWVESGKPYSYSCIYASTQAKSDNHAAEKMISAIDLFVSILNMEQHFFYRSLHRAHQREPYNNVRLGPHQVLHYSDGKRNENVVWHGINYHEQTFPKNISERKNLPGFIDTWLSYLRSHPFENVLRRSIAQYHSALNQNDYHIAVMMLWSALEIITDTTKSESKVTVRRVCALAKEPEIAKIKLEHIADVRNNYAHSGTQDHLIFNVVEYLRGWVEIMLRYAAYSGRSYKHIYDFCAVLDKASSIAALEKDFHLTKKALKLVKG